MVNRFGRGWLAFWLVQAIVVSVACAATAHRLQQLDHRRDIPPLRNEPLTIKPQYNVPEIITDQQLRQILHKLRPRLRGAKPKINFVDHALRFWGVEATFADPECLSGAEMRDMILNDSVFKNAWGDDSPPLLVINENGVAVRTQEGRATASHVDHTLCTLAEVGVPLDYPIHTATGQNEVRAILEHSLREFSLNQLEYEWSALAYALYLPPVRQWRSTEGQEITFDVLADRIMRQRLNQGVCLGNHRLHTLVMLLRVDDQVPILAESTRERIHEHLQDATRRLIASQHSTGYWIRSWPDGKPPTEAADETINTLPNRILGTGHVLEWWALAPQDVHPPREVMIRASQWLARTIEELDDEKVTEYYTFLTHAGRALALWRGDFPAAFLEHENEPTGGEELRDAIPLSIRNIHAP